MKYTNEGNDVALSPVWLTAGTLLFVVAVSTPLVVLNYNPEIRQTDQTVRAANLNGLVDERLEVQADEEPELSLAEYEETLAEETLAEETLGSLATLIDEHGMENRSTTVPAVRRMVLDAVSVDLESSRSVNALNHLRVPIRDCDRPGKSEEVWLIDEGPMISDALRTLPSDLPNSPNERVAGPMAHDLATTHNGVRVEYCADRYRISAVEILPLEAGSEPVSGLTVATLGEPVAATFGNDAVVVSTKSVTVTPAESLALSAVSGGKLPASSVSSMNADAVTGETAVRDSLAGITPRYADGTRSPAARPGAAVSQNLSRASGARAETPAPDAPTTSTPSALLANNGDAFSVATDVAPTSLKPDNSAIVLASVKSMPEETFQKHVSFDPATLTLDIATIEDDLNLNQRGRWAMQLRLALIGYDPKGIDGIFGNGTRNAIARLQESEALPATGYLDEITLAVLKRKSRKSYANWVSQRAKKRAERRASREVPVAAPQQVRNLPAARRAPECTRNNKGIIVSNQSFDCDLNVLREGLGSLFGTAG